MSEPNLNEYCQKILDLTSYNEESANLLGKKIASVLLHTYFPYRGYKFKINSVLDAVVSCSEYDYSDIRKTDRVLDIGACVGAFSILASGKCKQVYAVEPLYGDLILENLILNKIQNVSIIPYGMGKTNCQAIINYDPRTAVVELRTFDDILKVTGKCDFLKLDCEMWEWILESKDLEDFRRVEIEVHNHDGKHDYKNYEKKVIDAGFDIQTDSIPNSVVYIIHGYKK